MGKQYRAMAVIHHSTTLAEGDTKTVRKVATSGFHKENKTIDPGTIFDASAVGMTSEDVARLVKLGHIRERDDEDAIKPDEAGVTKLTADELAAKAAADKKTADDAEAERLASGGTK